MISKLTLNEKEELSSIQDWIPVRCSYYWRPKLICQSSDRSVIVSSDVFRWPNIGYTFSTMSYTWLCVEQLVLNFSFLIIPSGTMLFHNPGFGVGWQYHYKYWEISFLHHFPCGFSKDIHYLCCSIPNKVPVNDYCSNWRSFSPSLHTVLYAHSITSVCIPIDTMLSWSSLQWLLLVIMSCPLIVT